VHDANHILGDTEDKRAFPSFDEEELGYIRKVALRADVRRRRGDVEAGDAEMDMFVIETGGIAITNPADDGKEVAHHCTRGQFSGDIDLLTGRPVIVDGTARGRTRVLRVANDRSARCSTPCRA
jgi:thioredoxin reductase (NADPH)